PETFFSGQVFLPKDGVLAKTFSLEVERGNPQSRRRLETQILHYDGRAWRGYSYAWNDEQTDATLVPTAGADRTLTVSDKDAPGGRRHQTWHFPSRAECFQCHNPWTGYTLAFTHSQLDKDHDYGQATDNQLRTLQHVNIVKPVKNPEPGHRTQQAKLHDPYDANTGLDERARSYLHVNCSHCHQFAAGGTAGIN